MKLRSLALIAVLGSAIACEALSQVQEGTDAKENERLRRAMTAQLIEELNGFRLEKLEPIFKEHIASSSTKLEAFYGDWKLVGKAWFGADKVVDGSIFGRDEKEKNSTMPSTMRMLIGKGSASRDVEMKVIARLGRKAELFEVVPESKPEVVSTHKVKSSKDGGISTYSWPLFFKSVEPIGLWEVPVEGLEKAYDKAASYSCGKFKAKASGLDFLICREEPVWVNKMDENKNIVLAEPLFPPGNRAKYLYLLFSRAPILDEEVSSTIRFDSEPMN